MNLGVVPQPVVPVPALVLTASPRRDETFCRFDVLPFFFFFSAICKSPSAIVDPIHCLAYHVADKREPLVPGPDRSGAKETFQAFAWEKPRYVEYPSFGERFPSFGKKPGHLITWHPCGPHVLLHAQQLSTECIYSSALLRCCGAAVLRRAAVLLSRCRHAALDTSSHRSETPEDMYIIRIFFLLCRRLLLVVVFLARPYLPEVSLPSLVILCDHLL